MDAALGIDALVQGDGGGSASDTGGSTGDGSVAPPPYPDGMIPRGPLDASPTCGPCGGSGSELHVQYRCSLLPNAGRNRQCFGMGEYVYYSNDRTACEWGPWSASPPGPITMHGFRTMDGSASFAFAVHGYPAPGGALPDGLRPGEVCTNPSTLRNWVDVDLDDVPAIRVRMQCTDDDGQRVNTEQSVLITEPEANFWLCTECHYGNIPFESTSFGYGAFTGAFSMATTAAAVNNDVANCLITGTFRLRDCAGGRSCP